MIIDEEVYLEHYGKPGMKWGVRKAARAEVRGIKQKHRTAEKAARNDPSFKSEVKATRKKQGISGSKVRLETSNGKSTGRLVGDFKNSKNKKVSDDFANAVLAKASRNRDWINSAAAGTAVLATLVATQGNVRLFVRPGKTSKTKYLTTRR
jgi:hypothetical protein